MNLWNRDKGPKKINNKQTRTRKENGTHKGNIVQMVLEGIKLQDPEARVEAEDDKDEGDEEEDPEDDDDPYVPLGDGIKGEPATRDDGDGVFAFPGCYDGQHRHIGDIPTQGRRRL